MKSFKRIAGWLWVLGMGSVSVSQAFGAGYYDQFQFTAQGDCNRIATVYFTSAGAIEFAELGRSPEGQRQFALMMVQLFDDSNYWVKYSEQVQGEQGSSQVYVTTRQGKWSEDAEGRLILSDIGYGTPDQYAVNPNRKIPSIRFHFTKPLNNPAILTSTMNIVRAMSNIGPRGRTAIQYCNSQ